jgi:hypothetical protein
VADPVSWLLIEPGWRVETSDGEKVGRVDEVLADEEQDIFSGLVVHGERVPAERVAEIREGVVVLGS